MEPTLGYKAQGSYGPKKLDTPRSINLPVKLAVLGIAIFIALVSIIGYLSATLKNLDYFKIKDIIANKPQGAFDFSYLSGRSIFSIDLKKESRYISELYPVYKNIRLFRLLPNRLFIGFTDRNPLAYVKLYRYFCVDSERVLFDLPQGREAEDLPVIIGLERKIPGPKPGIQYNIKELITVLNIIKEAEANNLLKKYRIGRIDVTNPADISCFIRFSGYFMVQESIKHFPIPLRKSLKAIAEGDFLEGQAATNLLAIEVKMGQDDISDNIRVLAGLFTQLNDDIRNIKYIDLRFKEPVVKFKNAT